MAVKLGGSGKAKPLPLNNFSTKSSLFITTPGNHGKGSGTR